jgi:hypothetical protein
MDFEKVVIFKMKIFTLSFFSIKSRTYCLKTNYLIEKSDNLIFYIQANQAMTYFQEQFYMVLRFDGWSIFENKKVF